MAKPQIETRVVENKVRNPDGSVTTVTVTERRPAVRHNAMMRHMANLAARAKQKAEQQAAETPAMDDSPLEPAHVPAPAADEPHTDDIDN